MTSLTLHISGMSCGHCLNAVRNALTGAVGVELRSVQMGRAELVTDAGYAATPAPAGV